MVEIVYKIILGYIQPLKYYQNINFTVLNRKFKSFSKLLTKSMSSKLCQCVLYFPLCYQSID